MTSLAEVPEDAMSDIAEEFYRRCVGVLQDEEFGDLITRAIDHRSRTLRRFEIWHERVTQGIG